MTQRNYVHSFSFSRLFGDSETEHPERRMGRFFNNGAPKPVIECRNVQKSVEYCGIPLETHEHPERGVMYCIWCRQFFELLEFRESRGNAG